MTKRKVEETVNATFAGLALFYRDTDLSETLISRYQTGQIIMERGFTDMTYKTGGLKGNFRYLIASSAGKDLSAINPSFARYGHIVLHSGAYFKVLDVYRTGDKTQVLLLNIPADAISFFRNTAIGLEEELVKKARENFDQWSTASPVEELQAPEWTGRIEFPLGMNDEGELFFVGTEEVDEEEPPPPPRKKPWWRFGR